MLFPLDKPFDQSVLYTLNKQGYRCQEWHDINWADSHVLFGCSVVQGIGLRDDQTLDTALAQLLGEPVVNLGAGGCSLPFILANTYRLLDAGVRPKSVILVNPEPSRVALFSSQAAEHVGAWYNDKWYHTWIKNNNAEYYGYLASRSIVAAWRAESVNVASFHQPDVPGPEDLPRYVDVAADNSHPGPNTVKLWAEHIAKKKPA
jgi:hypothetical protein